jgi:hypothetical protein
MQWESNNTSYSSLGSVCTLGLGVRLCTSIGIDLRAFQGAFAPRPPSTPHLYHQNTLSIVLMTQAHLRAHSEYYFLDGNFCIVADGVVFRLYAGQWARRSSVLKRMLELPSDNPQNTGVPPILRECRHTLWMDERLGANDIEALCKYIYDDV